MYVYFIKAGSSPPMLKIGKARRPQLRMSELQTGCPFELKLLGTLRCKNDSQALDTEWQLHNLFRKEAFRGEWFRYTGPLPHFVHQILKNGDVAQIKHVFAEAFEVLKSARQKKSAPVVVTDDHLTDIDHESLSHLRSIRAEGNA